MSRVAEQHVHKVQQEFYKQTKLQQIFYYTIVKYLVTGSVTGILMN